MGGDQQHLGSKPPFTMRSCHAPCQENPQACNRFAQKPFPIDRLALWASFSSYATSA